MARPLRLEFEGAIYHVTCRMLGDWRSDRERLFRDDRDYGRFLHLLAERAACFEVRLFQFCLMGNHFHLVLETPRGNVSRFMQSLNTAYTVYFNLRHQRHGHLLDGRFKAKLVSGDNYLLRLTRYVHQNPVWTEDWRTRPLQERVAHLRSFRWSSYGGYIQESRALDFIEYQPVLAMMTRQSSQRRQRYAQYVESGLAAGDEELELALRASAYGIGNEEFIQSLELRRAKVLKQRRIKSEDVAFRRVIAPLPPEEVMSRLAATLQVEVGAFRERRRNSVLRAMAAKYLVGYACLTQRQVADCLGLSTGSAVSSQLRRLRNLEASDTGIRRQCRTLESVLTELRARSRPEA